MSEQTVESVLQTDQKALEKARAKRGKELPRFVLREILERVLDRTKDIETLKEAEPNARAFEKLMKHLVAAEISAAAGGLLTVAEYSQKCASKQAVYVFVGTHWEEIRIQTYYDFCKKAAKKVGLKDIYSEDQDFMNWVFENVAFRASKDRFNDFPFDEVWINLQNGTLEINSEGAILFREHRAEDFFVYCLPYCYSPRARCRKWHLFLDMVLPDKDVQKLLAEYIGYCFTRDLRLERMAVFYGTGCNGKSVVLEIVEALMGRKNVSNISLSTLTLDDEKRSLLENKLVNISHESNRNLDTDMLKQLVSGDPTDVRQLYRGTHTMTRYAKFFTSFNRLPPSEHTVGYFRRWLLFPFDVTISEEVQDHELAKKLKGELSGILNWVLAALLGLLKRKSFSKCSVCENRLKEYQRDSNSALLFLTEMCEVFDGRNTVKSITDAYKKFCYEEGIDCKFQRRNFLNYAKNFGAKIIKYQGQDWIDLRLKEYEF